MPSISPNTTVKEYQKFIEEIYGLPNDRFFTIWDMLSNMTRFTMRGLKGIRKGDVSKTRVNLLIALSWFMSTLNHLHIDVESEIWERFPYLCSYCGNCPCSCKKNKADRKKVPVDNTKRPKTLEEFQVMFERIYPSTDRALEHTGVHLAEELGELSEALLTYMGGHRDYDFKNIMIEAADYFSCVMGVFNSLNLNLAKELSVMFDNNCHVCKQSPCECGFTRVMEFVS